MSAGVFALAILGCGVGSVARFWIGTWRKPHHVPWATIAANVLGTFVFGVAAALTSADAISESTAFVLGAGVAGGLTTFSTLAVDAVVLWRASRRASVVYLFATAAAGTCAGLLGLFLGSAATA